LLGTHVLKLQPFEERPNGAVGKVSNPMTPCGNTPNSADLQVAWKHYVALGWIEPSGDYVSADPAHGKHVVLGVPSKPPVQAVVTLELLLGASTFANSKRFDLKALEIDVPTIFPWANCARRTCLIYRIGQVAETRNPVRLRFNKSADRRFKAHRNIAEVYRSDVRPTLMLPPPFFTTRLPEARGRAATLTSVNDQPELLDNVEGEVE
jgi:hypothetical protein